MLLVPTVGQRRNALMKEHAEGGHSEDERLEPEMASPLPVPIAPVQSCSPGVLSSVRRRFQAELSSAKRVVFALHSSEQNVCNSGCWCNSGTFDSIKALIPAKPRRSASMVPKIATLLEWNR